MALDTLGIIALILIIAGIIKILVLAINPKAWMNFARGIWRHPSFGIIYFILAVVVFYFLIQELTVVQILATTAFVALLMGLQFARYSKDVLRFVEKFYKGRNDLWAKNWFYILIWLVLMIWGLFEIFG